MKNEKLNPCIACGSTHKTERAMFYDEEYYCPRHYMQIRLKGKIFKSYKDGNEIVKYENYAEIILYFPNRNRKEKGRAIIDIEDVNKIKDIYWSISYDNYVYNALIGFLHHFIIGTNSDNYNEIVTDHINRNRLDCRKENLRIVNRKVNAINKGKQSNNTTGYVGISKIKSGKFRAYIKLDGKQIHLGHYENIEDAISARKEAEIKYFGQEINREYDCNTVFKKESK